MQEYKSKESTYKIAFYLIIILVLIILMSTIIN